MSLLVTSDERTSLCAPVSDSEEQVSIGPQREIAAIVGSVRGAHLKIEPPRDPMNARPSGANASAEASGA